MSNSDRQLLGVGVFLVIIAVGILLTVGGVIGWGLFVPVVMVLTGCWALVLGVVQVGEPQKYERSAFSTMVFGVGLIALGVAWYLFSIKWIYSLVVILLVIAVLAITTALRRK